MPHVRENDWSRAEQALEAQDPLTLDPQALEAWYRFRGVAAFRLGKRDLAFTRFQEGLQACPESKELRFSMAQEHELRGQTEAMIAQFDAMVFPDIPFPYALAGSRFAYLWGRSDRAWAYLAPILSAYEDPQAWTPKENLPSRLPPFAQTWSYALTYAYDLGTLDALEVRLKNLEKYLATDVFEEHQRFLEGWTSGDFSGWVQDLQQKLKGWEERPGLPPLLMLLQQAVLQAQAEPDIAKAAGILASVRLDGPGDAWLEDARLLATLELLERRGASETLAQMTDQFFQRQPFLLEPDAAALSGLLSYQSGLRSEYQRRRPLSLKAE